MLVLSRHLGESIVIDRDILITVIAIRGDKVRLGIKAPDSVRVDRQEVYEAIMRDGKDGAGRAADREPGTPEDFKKLPVGKNGP